MKFEWQFSISLTTHKQVWERAAEEKKTKYTNLIPRKYLENIFYTWNGKTYVLHSTAAAFFFFFSFHSFQEDIRENFNNNEAHEKKKRYYKEEETNSLFL